MTGLSGVFTCKVYDRRRRLLSRWEWRNAAVYEGMNALLDAFGSGALASPWYVGLVTGGGSPTYSAADTMASHPGWAELTSYSEVARPAWTPGSASSGSKTSSAPSVFTMSADVSVRGAFLCSDATKGGAGGLLWATAPGGNRTLLSGQSFEVTYTNRLTPIS